MKHRVSFEVEETKLVWAINLLSSHNVSGLAVSCIVPEAPRKQAGVRTPIQDTKAGSLLLAFVREHGTVDRESVKNYAAGQGLAAQTGPATLAKLVEAGFVKKIGRGAWAIA